jgi:hypothetical protein
VARHAQREERRQPVGAPRLVERSMFMPVEGLPERSGMRWVVDQPVSGRPTRSLPTVMVLLNDVPDSAEGGRVP